MRDERGRTVQSVLEQCGICVIQDAFDGVTWMNPGSQVELSKYVQFQVIFLS